MCTKDVDEFVLVFITLKALVWDGQVKTGDVDEFVFVFISLNALVWESQVRSGDEMKMNLALWNALGLKNNLFRQNSATLVI